VTSLIGALVHLLPFPFGDFVQLSRVGDAVGLGVEGILSRVGDTVGRWVVPVGLLVGMLSRAGDAVGRWVVGLWVGMLSRVGDAVGRWVVGLWVGILVTSLIGALVHLLPFPFDDFVVEFVVVDALVSFPFVDFVGALLPFPGKEMGSSSQLSSS